MCSRNLMEETLAKVTAKHTMHWVQGAGHGLEIGSSEARNDMYHTLVTWCSEVCKQSLEYSSVECSRNLERQMAGRNTLTRLRKAAGGTSARRTHEDRKKTEMETHASNSPVLKTRRKRRRVADIE
ncbi:PREDICTED: uncharacterized protein LOC106805356 [Priapulus caudatus]|uniref:Uncharacterized protein LOC106805356 n=1 Tax=Priapulus caudatus TaxID=37621 RepID=A0ABM1DR32_PRICU|nr:PREDICTED: uncharacterized protein LOC106805356 [Priapulus caudatus]